MNAPSSKLTLVSMTLDELKAKLCTISQPLIVTFTYPRGDIIGENGPIQHVDMAKAFLLELGVDYVTPRSRASYASSESKDETVVIELLPKFVKPEGGLQ